MSTRYDTNVGNFNQANYSIYGNNGAQAANLIPNLAEVANSEWFKVLQNTDRFNTWNGRVLSDDIQEKKFMDEYPYQLSFVGDKEFVKCTFKFNLLGFVKLKNLILQFPLFLKYKDRNLPTQVSANPIYYLLTCIKSAEIKIGENGLMPNSDFCNLSPFVNIFNQTFTKSELDKKILSQFGIGTSKQVYTPNVLPIIDENDARFIDSLTAANTSQAGKPFFRKVLSLPLHLIFPFFNQEGEVYFPTGIKLEMTVFLLNVDRPIVIDLANDTIEVEQVKVDSINEFKTDLRLSYEYTILRQPSQESFLAKWMKEPLRYNYYDFQRIETFSIQRAIVDEITTFAGNLTYNRGRPFEIIILPLISLPVWGVSYQISREKNGTNTYTNFPYNTISGINFEYIRLYINGQLIKDYKNKTSDQFNSDMSCYDILQMKNIDSMRSNMTKLKDDINLTSFINENNILRIPFSPDFYSEFMQGTDQGSSTIYYEMGIKNLIGTNYPAELNIYLRYVNQLLLDVKQNPIVTTWPSISTGNMNVMNQLATINTN